MLRQVQSAASGARTDTDEVAPLEREAPWEIFGARDSDPPIRPNGRSVVHREKSDGAAGAEVPAVITAINAERHG